MSHPNDPSLKSFVPVAETSDFPIQNLPFGIFSRQGQKPRVGVAIGDQILDLAVLEGAGLLAAAKAGSAFDQPALNTFASLGKEAWTSVRQRVSELLRHDNKRLRDDDALRAKALLPMTAAQLHRPFQIPAFTDFYSSEKHASNVGALFRDKTNPLLPNWKHLPVAYNGRASTVVVSGTPIMRPMGQVKPADKPPFFGPAQRLDYELEVGFFIGRENPHGQPIAVDQAEDYVFGLCLVNDWSARDHQSWEYVPLGPFLSKSFATTVSPWIVTLDALQPFKVALGPQDPEPLPYLQQRERTTYDVKLSVAIGTQKAKPAVISSTSYTQMYWSMAQQLAHHTVNGCKMEVGDLLASGTISGGEERSGWGCLLEMTYNGKEPIALPSGETRGFLEDGDEVVMRGWCEGKGYRIGFGDAAGQILPARG